MSGKTKAVIEFDMQDLEKGFFVTLQIPYSERNWWAVMSLRKAANIKVIRNQV